jgi:perosamine synthetase
MIGTLPTRNSEVVIVIPLFKPFMPESVIGPVTETLLSGWIGEGPKVKQFEAQLAAYLGVEPNRVLTVNSGTSALELALRLANVGPGDEVISTAMTCAATNEPILLTGARIRWADIDPLTGNISAKSIAEAINEKTKAIMIVHWGGYPCDLAEINDIADAHGVPVIEDAAHALGSEYQGKLIGNHSAFACYSFQAIKTITTVDGGLVVCRDPEAAHRGRKLRWFGIDREARKTEVFWEYDIEEPGYKFHMNDVAATIGIEQFKYLQQQLDHQRKNADIYYTDLDNLPGLTLPTREDDRCSSYWLMTVIVEERDRFVTMLRSNGIASSVVHIRNDIYTAFKDAARVESLAGLDSFTSKMLCIPIGYWVTEDDMQTITGAIKRGW